MKYIDFVAHLKNSVDNIYHIYGNDSFLCENALNLIKKKANLAFPDLNEVYLKQDVNVKEIIEACSVFPFADEYRLVVIKDYSTKNISKEWIKEFYKYSTNLLKSTILVFYNNLGEKFPEISSNVIDVDCDRLESFHISGMMDKVLFEHGAKMSKMAKEKLIMFCSSDMSRIMNELNKLISYSGNNEIQEKDIENLVVQDKEYQIFELSEQISKGNNEKVLDIVTTLESQNKAGFGIITPLYNNYRRAFFVMVNRDKTDKELATLLGVKEYAIKMMRNQIAVFTPVKLKQIVDMLAGVDRDIKLGKIKENIAIKMTVINILKIRGKDFGKN